MAEFLTHEALANEGITHGFFTRNGGVSEGIYASLNTGPGSDDNPTHVQQNRARVATQMGVAPSHLLSLYQVHSDVVVNVSEPWENAPEADAMVTATPGLALGILTADCAPVLFADAKAKVIGAAHAGWKGAKANIMERTVEEMVKLGADASNITAVVGPCIAHDSYEVGPEFYENFVADDANSAKFFTRSEKREGHYHFDLPAYVKEHLVQAGVGEANILAKDTCFHENAFFSNRRRNLRGEADYGRQISVITLKA